MSYTLILVLWLSGGTITTDTLQFDGREACLDALAELKSQRQVERESAGDQSTEIPRILGACVKRDATIGD